MVASPRGRCAERAPSATRTSRELRETNMAFSSGMRYRSKSPQNHGVRKTPFKDLMLRAQYSLGDSAEVAKACASSRFLNAPYTTT